MDLQKEEATVILKAEVMVVLKVGVTATLKTEAMVHQKTEAMETQAEEVMASKKIVATHQTIIVEATVILREEVTIQIIIVAKADIHPDMAGLKVEATDNHKAEVTTPRAGAHTSSLRNLRTLMPM